MGNYFQSCNEKKTCKTLSIRSYESNIKKQAIALIKKKFPSVWVYKTTDRWVSGIPDLLLCQNGQLIAIELKRKGEKPKKIQEHTLQDIAAAGGTVAVCYSAKEVEQVLKEVIGKHDERA